MTVPAHAIPADSPLHQQMQQWRRDLHQYPETAFEENRTSAVVTERLQALGLEVHTGIAQTGVVGILRGSRGEGRHIALRADMDALPLQELNTFAHASRHDGCMHACGHDGHTSMLLGAVTHLARQPDFAGTLYFIFQPAEEGQAGAYYMLEDGLLERFPIEEIYGMHNWPTLPAGAFAVHAGAVMASADRFEIVVTGVGGHGAMPDTAIDPVLASAQLITALQSIVARNINPVDSAVISVTDLHAGQGAFNVIPESVRMLGTLRSLSQTVRDQLMQRIRQVAENTAAAFGAQASVSFKTGGYPATVNHVAQATLCHEVVTALVGADRAHWNPPPSMGAEDFAFFLQQRPGAYIWIGNGGNGQHCHALHNPHYDFNDTILPLGASYWVALAQRLCRA
ncbi:MAG TPA: M20 aminoacylase family protein [Thiolinea sp.]|nr:M20 aminoacylase family protein [Thiolinea sp.]